MKYALITGAYGGMGLATVDLLVKNGWTVFALDKKVNSPTQNVYPIQADLTSIDSVTNAFFKVKKVTEKLDAVIHFAGIYDLNSLVEIDQDAFDRIFKINVYGAYYVNKIFLPLLKTGSKIIITTSELAPLDPLPFTGIYAVTKSALEKYALSLRMELQLLGIKVAVLRPGAVKTNLLGDSTTALDNFCRDTTLYNCNAKRFKGIVESVEAKNVKSEKIAKKVNRILSKKNPKPIWNINRNPLLRLLNVFPKRFQCFVIRKILK